MRFGHGSFGQELWLGFFSVAGSLEHRQASREFDYYDVSETRWWEDFLVEIPVSHVPPIRRNNVT